MALVHRFVKSELEGFLQHNGNRFPSVPLAHAASMKECYKSMKPLLEKIKYYEFKWKLCVGLKLWHCYWECNLGTQNTAVSCVSGTAGTRRITM